MNGHLSVQNSPTSPLCQRSERRLSSAHTLPAAPGLLHWFSFPKPQDGDVGWGDRDSTTALGAASRFISAGSVGHRAGAFTVFSKDYVSPRYQLDTEMKTVSAWTINKEFPAVSWWPDSLCSCDVVATPSCLRGFITVTPKGPVPHRWGASCNTRRYQTPCCCQCRWSVQLGSCTSSLLAQKWVSRQGMEGKMTFPMS